ncbi:transposase [Paraglaciecola aquimarina]|uniref:Transposase n=1 Tax=Paraglaciecola aquimarina TaxID=1235557 RepID=A0ABU3SWM5_9ALTE|nr:transposase [Paraglaciecola aquimarina]MDU0354401.1 transposase [Paraglaciecola aquimarina]
MPQSRKSQISLVDTPYYHCVSRCVRRSFLCGEDTLTGQSYEHRRAWVETRLLHLSRIFAIDICAYAVMSNHTHVVLCVNKPLAERWTVKQVLVRWHQLHKGTLLSQRFMRDDTLSKSERHTLLETVEIYRLRLYDISWLMRNLNEYIAREANKEDACTGRFWEGRFKSQALLDKSALLACMAYVDLNPIRANMANTPEDSDHTSIQTRIQALRHHQQPRGLMPFVGNLRQNMPRGIAFSLKDYCDLIDTTGRVIRDDKSGLIDTQQQHILQRLGLNNEQWLTLTTEFEKHFCYAVGSEHLMRNFSLHTQHQKIRGIGKAKTLLKHA